MSQIPKEEWMPRFATRFAELDLSAPRGLSLSVAAVMHQEAANLAPEEAAEIYVLEEPSIDCPLLH